MRSGLFRLIARLLSGKQPRRARAGRARPRVESLEDRLAPAVNPVVAENALPGTPASVWDQWVAFPAIEGYATNLSVDQGQSVSFKIDDPGLIPYRLDIYRSGYYGGLGARKVDTISSSQALRQNQPAPLTNAATGLIDAGNWAVSATWAVPATATSGVYFAHIVREDTGQGLGHIMFVVRDDDGGSDMLFQTSDATWQAYNNWGGNSLYQGSPDNRAYKVSYNRPLATRYASTNGREDYFSFEYPMVRWLEANGYNVSYFTNVDSDRFGAELLEHKVFLSVGHDEYWSGPQRANVEAARDAGVNLAFFSGNEVYWKTRWENSIDASNTPYRTLVTYKESRANAKIDPSPTWTGLWRDPRFSPPSDGGRPENALTGTIFTVNRGPGGETGTSFEVPAEFANLRFWRDTSVANLQPGQVATLGDQVLGYEWDEDLDNGFRPAGLLPLSQTTQVVPEKLLDYGSTVGVGTATHRLTLYRAASGALVFGAGTVQWSWGLEGTHHGVTTVPDPAMRQATVNLFGDMGVQADTLQPGLVRPTISTDVARPTSTLTSHSSGASFTAGQSVTLSGTASDTGGGVVGVVEVSTDGGVSWHRATGRTSWTYQWSPSSSGQAVILTRATDDSLNIESPGPGITVNVSYAPTSTTGLVAQYSFNASSGTTLADSSGQGNNGTLNGPAWVAGKFGNALSFDGTNDLVTVNDAASLDLTGAMTVEAWVRPTTLADFTTVVLKERSPGLAYALYASDGTNNPPSSYVHIGSADPRAAGLTVLPLNTWSHLATTYDGANLKFYVNGALVSTQVTTGNIATSTGALRIGGNSIWGEYFNGLIDEVRIYNRALSEGEIRYDLSTPIGGSLDAVPPTGSVSGPANGATVSGIINVTATAADNVAVAGVQFLLNGALLGGEDTLPTFSTSWDTRQWANGAYVLSARIRDVAGNTITTANVNVTVNNPADTTAPTAKVTYPGGNLRVSGAALLTGAAADNVGVAGLQFKVNGANIGAELTAAPFRTTWNTTALADGDYTLTAVARDAANNTTTSTAVTVTVDNTRPTVTAQSPALGATNVAVSANVTVTFSEDIEPTSLSFTLRDSSNSAVAAVVSYDTATRTATLNPSADLNTSATYTAAVNSVRDLAGNYIATPVSWTFATAGGVSNATIFDATATPATASSGDTSAVELGVKFQTTMSGFITGVRFYKGSGNTGTHVGSLWTASGTLLATATFTGETASGWQQVNFNTPVAVTANTTYVASYHAPNGGYAVNSGYFASAGAGTGAVRALSNAAGGGNGVYRYGAAGNFPNQAFNSSNYWVDAVFNSSLDDVTPPTVVAQAPASGEAGVAKAANVAATFSEAVQPATIVFQLRDSSNALVPATVTYDSANRTVTLNPDSDLALSATYTATLSGAQDQAGNTMSAVSWSFTTSGADTTAPTVVSRSPAPGATAVAPMVNVTATFDESVQFSTISFVLRDPSNNAVAGRVTYNDVTRTATFNPDADLNGSTVYTATLSGAQDLAGNTMTASTWSFTTDAVITNQMVWSNSVTPQVASANDNAAVEVGVKFRSTKAGYITGLRFYKGSANTGTHVGRLWTVDGVPLGSVTFAGETATGWQQATFASPILISPNTIYVASYYAPNGGYSYNGGYFATTGVTNGPLEAVATGVSGSNGVFRYGAGGGFPNQAYNSTNYWVDVVFSNQLADTAAPTVVATTPSGSSTNVSTGTALTATFSEGVQSSTISFTLRDSANNVVPAVLSYDSATFVATLTPTALLNPATAYTATVTGARDLAGNTMVGSVSWSFTTTAGITNAKLWDNTVTPAVASAGDNAPIELGVKFRSDLNGYITALRFYKGPANTGTHVGRLWAIDGTLLATATFTNETETGWQEVAIAPVAVTANTTYIASYHAPNGGYAYDHGYFASNGLDNSPLHALANGANGGNGVFTYGPSGSFPSSSFNSTNYWVDVVFNQALSDTAPPTSTDWSPAAGATAVSISANVTATFSEAVLPGTISFTLKDANNVAVAASVSYDSATRIVTLDPTASLAPQTAYTASLSGAQDLAGNSMSAVTWTFTTHGVWSQSTTADFNAGAHSGTSASEAASGLQLAPSFAEYFTGTALGAAWTTGSWTADGGAATSITVSGGALAVEGGLVSSAQTYVGKAVEGRVNFGANRFQHFGLATGLSSVSGSSWALFGTANSTDTLFARVNANGTTQDVNLGALPSGFHTYRIKPVASGFEFYVDGTLQTTINLTFPANTAARVAFSAFLGAPALQADWVRVLDYPATGSFISSTFDAGRTASWGAVNWTALLPAGTTIRVETSSSDSPTGGWSSWAEVLNGGTVLSPSARYLRYRITITSSDPTVTALLQNISFIWL